MRRIKISLYWKIVYNNIILFVIITSIIGLVHYERHQRARMESQISEINYVQDCLNNTHRGIIELSLLGESVFNWKEENYKFYCEKEKELNDILLTFKNYYKEVKFNEQLDTIIQLFHEKRNLFLHIMNIINQRAYTDSLVIHKLPTVSKQATRSKQILKKKKGILGLLGGKKKMTLPPASQKLFSLNDTIINLQKEYERGMRLYTDSLNHQNELLNDKLNKLLKQLNKHIKITLAQKEQSIQTMHNSTSFWMISELACASILLILSSVVIQRYIKRNQKDRMLLEQINKQNKEMLEMRKKMILTISHDIRGPLTTINGNAELALETLSKEKNKLYIENIITSGKHILRLVNSLLNIHRLDESKETVNNVPFKLYGLINHIIIEFTPIVNNKGLAFLTEKPQTDFSLYGDINRIEQIINNLLSNAIKFTKTGTIEFTTKYQENDNNLIFIIHDTGIGMDTENIQNIFNPFEKASNTTNTEGFGLGLSITKGLVNLLGGTITVESKLKEGSTFTIQLPVSQTNEEIIEETENTTDSIPCPSLKILIIDDDPMQLEITKEMLERNGMLCMTCNIFKDVIRAMRRENFDLILTDIQMPENDGFTLLNLLRNSNIGNSKSIPILAMTAREDNSMSNITNAGFVGCIYKPFNQKDLLRAIDSATQQNKNKQNFNFGEFTVGINNKEKIFNLFKDETLRDIQTLEKAWNCSDITKIRDIVHHLLPLWEMAGCDKTLRKMQQILHEEKINENILMTQIKQLQAEASSLVEAIEKEINRLRNEKDTDC